MACSKNCGHDETHRQNSFNNSNYVFIVLILYILLAIIIGGSLIY